MTDSTLMTKVKILQISHNVLQSSTFVGVL